MMHRCWPPCIEHFGTKPFKAADAFAVHERVADHRRSPQTVAAPTPTEEALHEAIEDVLGGREAKCKRSWLLGASGQRGPYWGFILETQHNITANANDITVKRI